MSSFLKMLPLAVIGYVAYQNSTALKKGLNVVGQVQITLASVEINHIGRAVRIDYEDSHRLPLDNFAKFLNQNMVEASGKITRDHSCDSWRTPYRIKQTATGFAILSAGPDRVWNTADDIRQEFTLE